MRVGYQITYRGALAGPIFCKKQQAQAEIDSIVSEMPIAKGFLRISRVPVGPDGYEETQ